LDISINPDKLSFSDYSYLIEFKKHNIINKYIIGVIKGDNTKYYFSKRSIKSPNSFFFKEMSIGEIVKEIKKNLIQEKDSGVRGDYSGGGGGYSGGGDGSGGDGSGVGIPSSAPYRRSVSYGTTMAFVTNHLKGRR